MGHILNTLMATGTTTRLAPSPTGALHLGNLRTFLANYLMAVRNGWRVLMRVEDLDGPRIKAGSAGAILEELAWLGLRWEQPVTYQSQRAYAYEAALGRLVGMGMAYPCTCTRKDIASAGGAPHSEDAVDTYPGSCRGRYSSAAQATGHVGRPVSWRVQVPDEDIEVADRFAGTRLYNLARCGGDFVICKCDGLAAYQLAVVVDDCASGVDAIIRGDDLLESAARQAYLRRLLGLSPEPAFWHLPLVVGPDGRRLAKRHGDTRLSRYRQLGASPERVLGLLAFWCGLLPSRREIGMAQLIEQFDVERIPRKQVVFTMEDDLFLRGA